MVTSLSLSDLVSSPLSEAAIRVCSSSRRRSRLTSAFRTASIAGVSSTTISVGVGGEREGRGRGRGEREGGEMGREGEGKVEGQRRKEEEGRVEGGREREGRGERRREGEREGRGEEEEGRGKVRKGELESQVYLVHSIRHRYWEELTVFSLLCASKVSSCPSCHHGDHFY